MITFSFYCWKHFLKPVKSFNVCMCWNWSKWRCWKDVKFKDLDFKRHNDNDKNGKLFKKQDDKKAFFFLFSSCVFLSLFHVFIWERNIRWNLEHFSFCVFAISYSNLESFEVEGFDTELLFDLSCVLYENAVTLWHLWFTCVQIVVN